jgi:hypothetical protein
MNGGLDLGITCGDPACNCQPRVVCSPRAKEDFKRRIILFEEACEVSFEIRFVAMERLEDTYRRGKINWSCLATPGTISNDPRYHHDAVDRGGNEAKYAQGEQEMEHRDTVSPDNWDSYSLDYSGERTSAYAQFSAAHIPQER